MASDGTAPGHTEPGHMASGSTAPGHAEPGHMASDSTAPGHAEPDHMAASHRRAADTGADGTEPDRTAAGPATPGVASDGQVFYLGMPLRGFLDALSAGRAAPGGGCAAALAVALGASLCAMAARLSARHLASAAGLAEQAELLRDRAAALGQADAESYSQVLAVLRLTRQAAEVGDQSAVGGHAPGLADALSAATEIPAAVVETGAQVARLAARLARYGNPNLRGDAVTAALLAEAGAKAAAALALINHAEARAAGAPASDSPARVRRLLRAAARSAAHAQRPR
jgi:methenyltetrahydrofolate cyclohydrolase